MTNPALPLIGFVNGLWGRRCRRRAERGVLTPSASGEISPSAGPESGHSSTSRGKLEGGNPCEICRARSLLPHGKILMQAVVIIVAHDLHAVVAIISTNLRNGNGTSTIPIRLDYKPQDPLPAIGQLVHVPMSLTYEGPNL